MTDPHTDVAQLEEARRFSFLGPILLFVLLTVVEISGILAFNDGIFTYTLDDPYIHLELAANLLQGHYGLNPGELCAPSSSILWPFLLAPFSLLPGFMFVPLLLNLVFGLGTVVLIRGLLGRWLEPEPSRSSSLLVGLLTALMIPATNLVGLMFTGMEHNLQLLLTVALFFGLSEEAQGRRAPWWTIAALVIGPLVRYENLALSVPALGYLFWRGRTRAVVGAGVLLLIGVGGFSLFLWSIGQALLPTSVLVKSFAVSEGGRLGAILGNLDQSMKEPQGLRFLFFLPILILSVFNQAQPRGERGLAGLALAASALHLAVGRFGWYARYEIYIVCFVLLTVVFLHRGLLLRYLDREPLWKLTVVLVSVLPVMGATYLWVLVTTPLAANNVYEQQYQMHRFVSEFWKAPVAANDIGWLVFQSDHYVLDLKGLASLEAFKRRLEGEEKKDPTWMGEMARESGVELAIIYDAWFPVHPRSWRLVGRMKLGNPQITVASSRVSFYATNPSGVASVRTQLIAFQRTLPEGVRLVIPGE